MSKPSLETPTVLSRIYVQDNGDLLVTDLWEELRQLEDYSQPMKVPGQTFKGGDRSEMDSHL